MGGVGVVGSIPLKKFQNIFYPNRNPRKKWREGVFEGHVCLWWPLSSHPPSESISPVVCLWSFVVKQVS
jgi:hypothetical protein